MARDADAASLRPLQRRQLDGEEFVRLRGKIKSLHPLRSQRSAADSALTTLRDERARLLKEHAGFFDRGGRSGGAAHERQHFADDRVGQAVALVLAQDCPGA